MKKLLILLLALVMCLTALTSCDQVLGMFWQPVEPQPEEPEVVLTDADLAIQYLNTLYKDKNVSSSKDYDLMSTVIGGKTTFEVSWYVNTELVSIKPSKEAGFVTVDVPRDNATETPYVLSAVITDADGKVYEKKFDRVLPVYSIPAADSTLSIPQANTLGLSSAHNEYTEGKYYVTGTVTKIASDKYGNMYIADADGNELYVYGTWSADGETRYDALDKKPVVGDTVTVYGIIGQYNGAPQMKNGWITEHKSASEAEVYDVITDLSTLKTGDKVLIGNPAHGKLLSMEKVSETSFYNKGVGYAADNFTGVTDSEIYVVTVNSDGTYEFVSVSGKVLALAESYSSLNDTGVNKTWSLEAVEGKTGLFYFKNVGRNTYLEWYADKDNWSTYNPSSRDNLFEMSLYLVEAGEVVDPQPPVEEPEDVTINVSDLTAGTTTDAELVAGSGISASAGLSIDENGKEIDGFTFTQRLKLGGTMKVSDGAVTKGVKIVTGDAATIVVYGMASSKDATGRTLQVATLTDGALVKVAETGEVNGTAIAKYTLKVEAAGTYYLGSTDSGINLYYIAVVYGEVETPAHECESVCAKCGKCTDETCEETVCADKCEGHVITGTVAEVLAGTVGETYSTTGTVVAINAKSFILRDATGAILVYLNKAPEVAVGDIVTVEGTTSTYNKGTQFGATAVVTKTGTETVEHGTATVLDPEAMTAYKSAEAITSKYVEVTGKLSISSDGKYYNLAVEGTEAQGSLKYLAGDLKTTTDALNGWTIKVCGYVVSLSSGKYVDLVVTSVEAVSLDLTVYYKNTNDWAKVNFWGWNKGGNLVSGNWPGTATMTLVEGTTAWYSYSFTLTDTTDFGFLFNNGVASGTKQTGDFKDLSKLWIYNNVAYATQAEADAKHEEDLASNVQYSEWFFAGSMNGWNTSANMLQLDADGSAWIVMTLAAGDEFKIAKGSSWNPQFNASKVTDKTNFGGTDNIVVVNAGEYKFVVSANGSTLTITPVVEETTTTVTMQYTGTTTTNMSGDKVDNATKLNLDSAVFEVSAAKNGNNNLPGLNKDGGIRMYSGDDGSLGNGNEITVTALSGKIVSIKITYKADTKGDCTVYVNDAEVTGTDGAYTINSASFTIKNTLGAKSQQIRIVSIEIVYEAE
jgi:hypothetical protein